MLDLDNDTANLAIANNLVQTALKSKKPYTVCVITIKDSSDKQKHSYNAWAFVSLDFDVLYNEGVIRKDGKIYMMTPETHKLVEAEKKRIARREKRQERKENAKDVAQTVFRGIGYAAFAGTCICVICGVVIGFGYGINRWVYKKQYKIDKQVQEYKLTLPNWDDSVYYATDDESLRRALDKREQALVQVEHYRDSLEKVYGKK